MVLGSVAALLVVLNLATTAFDPTQDVPGRMWSVFAVLPIGVAAAARWANELWLRPRALEAQRRLVAARELHPHATAGEDVEASLGERLERLSPRRSELEDQLAGARDASTALLEACYAAGPADAGLTAQGARLDAYRVALGNIEIDALLESGYLESPAPVEALRRAVAALQD